MSNRAWKRTRRKLANIERELDRRKRREMRVPWWVTVMSWLVDPLMRARWIRDWQMEHEAKLRRAIKVTAHAFKGRI